jgi:hypothetical protein
MVRADWPLHPAYEHAHTVMAQTNRNNIAEQAISRR